MYTFYALGTAAFLLCFLLTPICRDVAIRLNLLDQPDSNRKLHATPIPRLGGFAIVTSYAGALFLVIRFAPSGSQIHIQHWDLFRVLLPSAGIIFLTGLIDDLLNIKPWQKLLGQIAGASAAIGLGMHYAPGIITIATKQNSLPLWIGVPLTLVWLIVCTNAVNLIDGLDGLAAGVGLFATVTTLLAGLFTGNSGLVLATMPLAGALLAFLCYNFAPASIYLGDCGSLTIGFMLGALSLVWSHHNSRSYSLAAPLMVLALPLLDASLAIVRRYLRNAPIFAGDRGHIHHMVMARGFETKHAALILYAACGLAASLAVLQSVAGSYLHIVILVVFLLLIGAGLQYLRYAEFGAAGRAIFRSNLMRCMREEIYLNDLERELASLQSAEECWPTIVRVCEALDFTSIEMYFHEAYFYSTDLEETEPCDWALTIPLGERGYMKLRRPNLLTPPAIAMPVIELVQRYLSKRERELIPASSLIQTSSLIRTSPRQAEAIRLVNI
ncbi:MAG: MraY family glycosyltransferase [Edaphobacter sp.]|uniref:MraY family glycosyltransferase n=1 Tax=Edaphobacter sp. TaxID=1934404 RepID=UPI0023A78999|nr:MraY family glycosyltransferase [Edaphobacter sp.]MDE1175577.1 MraY family glycosyltransferase [Edaphobacter sp.]